ncbi:hypothetical protein [Microbacterium sp. ZW T5_56]|uniref:hypothetical protein n=1 Tax=Microbacterium sp. ZW T5_56 TaxID=3378081 RepID=UPI0038519DE9
MDFRRDLAEAETPAQVNTATIAYRDRAGARRSDDFALDLHQLKGAMWRETRGMHQLSKSVRGIAQKMGVSSF